MRHKEDYEYLHLMAESRGEESESQYVFDRIAFAVCCWGLLGLAVVIWRAAVK